MDHATTNSSSEKSLVEGAMKFTVFIWLLEISAVQMIMLHSVLRNSESQGCQIIRSLFESPQVQILQGTGGVFVCSRFIYMDIFQLLGDIKAGLLSLTVDQVGTYIHQFDLQRIRQAAAS